jgi:serine/threonine protein kinase
MDQGGLTDGHRGDADLNELETAVAHFESAWQGARQRGAYPEISDYLPSAHDQAAQDLFLELMLVDMEFRWKMAPPQGGSTVSLAGHDTSSPSRTLPSKPLVEDYFLVFEDFGPVGAVPDECIAEEYRVRHLWGDSPDHDSYAERFPKREGLVPLLLKIDRELTARPDREASGSDSASGMTAAEFWDRLARSGLVSSKSLAEFQEQIPPDRIDGAAVAEFLVAAKHLTEYQARSILHGDSTSLVLGNYTLLDDLGGGGMGRVFKARHNKMDRIVAVKLLAPALADDPEVSARFQREMKAAARLVHGNVALAFDADEVDGIHFLVMEYVDGKDLNRLVRDAGPLSVEQALELTIQAARGLEYAHANGVIHRDIKPSNLMLDSRGVVKVLDLGLAQLRAADLADSARSDSSLTATGQALGTVDYMPPEQAEILGKTGVRSDVYSLGCTFFSLLHGHPVYEGDSILAKVLAHRDAPIPSLCEGRDDVPEHLNAVFRKMVAKQPEERYGSMAEVIAALESVPPEKTDPDPPQKDHRFGRRLAMACSLLVLIVIGMISLNRPFTVETPDLTHVEPSPVSPVGEVEDGGDDLRNAPEEHEAADPPKPAPQRTESGSAVNPELELRIYYDEELVPIAYQDGMPWIPAPTEKTKVELELERKDHGEQVLGAVLKVNGESVIDRERKPDLDCRKWILKPGDELRISGFQVGGDMVEAFRMALSDRATKSGVISLAVYALQSELLFSSEGQYWAAEPVLATVIRYGSNEADANPDAQPLPAARRISSLQEAPPKVAPQEVRLTLFHEGEAESFNEVRFGDDPEDQAFRSPMPVYLEATDQMRLYAELDKLAYCYVVACRPDGKLGFWWPRDNDEIVPQHRFSVPSDMETERHQVVETDGRLPRSPEDDATSVFSFAILLIASESPLSATEMVPPSWNLERWQSMDSGAPWKHDKHGFSVVRTAESAPARAIERMAAPLERAHSAWTHLPFFGPTIAASSIGAPQPFRDLVEFYKERDHVLFCRAVLLPVRARRAENPEKQNADAPDDSRAEKPVESKDPSMTSAESAKGVAPAETPLSGVTVKEACLTVYRPDEDKALGQFRFGDGVLDQILIDYSSIRPTDQLRLHVELDRPAHCYALAVYPDGKLRSWWPMEQDPTEPQASFTAPPAGENRRYTLLGPGEKGEPASACAVFVIVADSPIPESAFGAAPLSADSWKESSRLSCALVSIWAQKRVWMAA